MCKDFMLRHLLGYKPIPQDDFWGGLRDLILLSSQQGVPNKITSWMFFDLMMT